MVLHLQTGAGYYVKDLELRRPKRPILDTRSGKVCYSGFKLSFVNIVSYRCVMSIHFFVLGVYFADMAVKSAGYCRAGGRNPVGLMLLSDVALGNVNEKFQWDYKAHILPKGKHSTKGISKVKVKRECFFNYYPQVWAILNRIRKRLRSCHLGQWFHLGKKHLVVQRIAACTTMNLLCTMSHRSTPNF